MFEGGSEAGDDKPNFASDICADDIEEDDDEDEWDEIEMLYKTHLTETEKALAKEFLTHAFIITCTGR